MSGETWLFGYGSLASPASIATTIGRHPADAVHVASVAGWGRRWNYGSKHLRGDWTHEGVVVVGGLVVSLGVAASPDEHCNGVVFRVDADELARLDWRERDYARVEVTEHTAVADGDLGGFGRRIEMYVPRESAIERYEQARDAGRAAVRRSYWHLVSEAFAALGDDHASRYAATPAPDVPVVDIALRPLP